MSKNLGVEDGATVLGVLGNCILIFFNVNDKGQELCIAMALEEGFILVSLLEDRSPTLSYPLPINSKLLYDIYQ